MVSNLSRGMGVCPRVSDALSYAIQWTDYLCKVK